MSDYRVLLYYKYIKIEDPETLKNDHLAYCKDLGVLGRIYVSEEGINGTLSGTVEQTDKYMEDLQADPRVGEVSFKIDEADGHAFKKMKVKVRNELASLHLEDYYNIEDVDPNAAEEDLHLDPAEFRQALLDDDVVVIDTRNDYEYEVGHFRGAINPDIPAFHQFPKWFMENKEKFMDKKVVIYCTGGIRCEKLAVWMTKEGVDTRQLRNGIHNYSTDPETQGDLWDGKMYVFDERLVVPINRVEETVVGRDHFDGSPCERYVNCGNPWCNKQFLCSEENEHKYLRGCTHECRVHPDNRYVAEHALSEADVEERLEAIDEGLVSQA